MRTNVAENHCPRTLDEVVLKQRDSLAIEPFTTISTEQLIHGRNIKLSGVTIYRILIISV
jgi:hypothetical protein